MTLLANLAAVSVLMQCPGHGYVESPQSKEREAMAAQTAEEVEGYEATVTLEDASTLRIVPPRPIIDFPGQVTMVTRSDDGKTVEAVRFLGIRRIGLQYDRTTGILVIAAPEGRWIGRCSPQPGKSSL